MTSIIISDKREFYNIFSYSFTSLQEEPRIRLRGSSVLPLFPLENSPSANFKGGRHNVKVISLEKVRPEIVIILLLTSPPPFAIIIKDGKT